MLTRINYFVLLIGALTAVSGFSQTKPAPLKVIYANGDVAYRTSAKSGWKPISMEGQLINLATTDNVRVAKQAILVLQGEDDKPLVFAEQVGEISIDAAKRAPKTAQSAVLSDYFKYLWYNLRHEHQTVDSYAKAYMKRKGVVSRDEGCTAPLMISPDYGAALPTDSSITFAWKREPGTPRYTLAIYDNYDPKANTLYTTETADTSLRFVVDKPFIHRETTYYWSVFPAGSPNCARYTFMLPKTETYRQLETRIADIQKKVQTDVALSAFLKAALYESNRYYPEAYRAYFDAFRASPNNALYRDGLTLFLARRGMVGQAERIQAMK